MRSSRTRNDAMAILILEGHTSSVESVAFSPDGLQIVSGSNDGSVRLWSSRTGQELVTLSKSNSQIQSVIFSPDGFYIASGSLEVSIRVWNAITAQISTALHGHESTVTSVAFSSDSLRLASGSRDKTVRLWDFKSGQALLVLTGHSGSVESGTFTPDSLHIVSGSDNKTFKIWDIATGQAWKECKIGDDLYTLQSVSFSPDGLRIAVGASRGSVYYPCHRPELLLWRINHLYEHDMTDIRLGGTDFHTSIKYDKISNPRRLYSTSSPLPLIGDSKDLDSDDNDAAEGHSSYIQSVAFSRNGCLIVSGSYDHTVQLWDARTRQHVARLGAHSDTVYSVAFSPDDLRIVSGSGDNTVRIWNVNIQRRNAIKKPLKVGHTDYIYHVGFSPNGRWIISNSDDQTTRIWDAQTAREIAILPVSSTYDAVAISPDGLQVTLGEVSCEVKRTRTGVGVTVREPKGLFDEQISSVSYSHDGGRVVFGSARGDGIVRVWNAQTSQELLQINVHTKEFRVFAAFSSDGSYIVSGCGPSVDIWDAMTGQQLAHGETDIDASGMVAFSPDNRTIYARCHLDTDNLRSWDITGRLTSGSSDSLNQ